MCIRDSFCTEDQILEECAMFTEQLRRVYADFGFTDILYKVCLLYTSDAADERSSVDLGGRRIIKKKKNSILVSGDTHIKKYNQTHN